MKAQERLRALDLIEQAVKIMKEEDNPERAVWRLADAALLAARGATENSAKAISGFHHYTGFGAKITERPPLGCAGRALVAEEYAPGAPTREDGLS